MCHRILIVITDLNTTNNSPSSQMMAMQARTMRSLSCSPSLPTAIREFVTELGKSCAFTVIIWTGKITDWDQIRPTQKHKQVILSSTVPKWQRLEVVPFWPVWGLEFSPPHYSAECQYTWTQINRFEDKHSNFSAEAFRPGHGDWKSSSPIRALVIISL